MTMDVTNTARGLAVQVATGLTAKLGAAQMRPVLFVSIILHLAALSMAPAAGAPARVEDAPSTRQPILKRWPTAGGLDIRTSTPRLAQRQAAKEMAGAGGVAVARIGRELAQDTGLQKGDHIITFDDVPIESRTHWQALIRVTSPGTLVQLEHLWQGERLATHVVIHDAMRDAERPTVVVGQVVVGDGKKPVCATIHPTLYRKDSGGWSCPGPCVSDDRDCFAVWLDLEDTVGPANVDLLAVAGDGRVGWTSVPVSPASTDDVVQIELQSGQVVSGQLAAGDGKGIADILTETWEVIVPGVHPKYHFSRSKYAEHKYYLSRHQVRTDANGRFALPALPRGSKVALEFAVPGYAKPPRGPYSLTRLGRPFVFGRNGIPREASIKGTVIASDSGQPVGPMTLSCRHRTARFAEAVPVAADGRFTVNGIPPGMMTCRCPTTCLPG